MRVMGLDDLVLISPRLSDVASHPEAIAFASGATDQLARSRSVGSLDEALAGISFAVALSAGAREFGPVPEVPEVAVRRALDELDVHPEHRVALVFGTERSGLSVEEAGRCQALCAIPGDPAYASLNLSQAVQLMAYLLRREASSRDPAQPTDGTAPRFASHEDVEALFAHLERALVAIRFLDPLHPKKLMARMRRLFNRTRLEAEEVQLLRGVCRQAELAARGELPGPRGPDSAR
jgi:tRNA/rRNA methyltransferase